MEMDDLNARLGQILSDPQSMAQLQSMAAALGLGQNSTTVNNTQNPPQNQAPASSTGGLGSLGTLGLLGGLLGSRQGAEDKNVQLLRALRPHMSPARQSRVDDAIRLIQLLGLLPALRDSGLLGGLLGGDRR